MSEEKEKGNEKGTALTKPRKKVSEKLTITAQDVTNYLCPEASPQEVALFLKTCQSEGLNPFAREIYLIKYQKDKPAQIVLSVDVFLKAAEASKEFDGFEAGIILQDSSGKLEFREGSFLLEEEKGKLRGGWAKVYRKDRSKPFYSAVTLEGYRKYTRDGHPTEFWADKKCPDMIRKVAISHALKEAFPNRLSTLYTEAEFEEVPEGTLPSAFLKEGEPEWNKFWIKVKEIGYTNKEEVHKLLGVASLKDWINSGNTLEDAIKKLADIKSNLEEFDIIPSAVELPVVEDKLLQGWKIVCESVKRLNLTDGQIHGWFKNYYRLEVGVADFLKPVPPAGVSNEILSRFQDSLNTYEESSRKK
jgi:phage recombination protein Bet